MMKSYVSSAQPTHPLAAAFLGVLRNSAGSRGPGLSRLSLANLHPLSIAAGPADRDFIVCKPHSTRQHWRAVRCVAHDVEYRRLGASGLKLPAVGLGGTTFGRYAEAAETARIIHAAIDCGATFVDTADAYNDGASEEQIGAALRGRRGDVVAELQHDRIRIMLPGRVHRIPIRKRNREDRATDEPAGS
jgi:hypothetical protein